MESKLESVCILIILNAMKETAYKFQRYMPTNIQVYMYMYVQQGLLLSRVLF
jgi:hypothetical protein